MCYLFHNKYFFIPDKKYKLKVNSTNIKYYISLNVNVFPSSVIKVKRLLSNLIFFEFCKIFKYWLSSLINLSGPAIFVEPIGPTIILSDAIM